MRFSITVTMCLVLAAAAPARADEQLMPGQHCKKGKLPSWTLDAATHKLSLGGFAKIWVTLPADWTAVQERPELIVLSAPASVDGVRAVYEIFVGPYCKRYEPGALQRSGARALAELMPAEAARQALSHPRSSAGLDGVALTLLDVTVQTPSGDRHLQLSESTDVLRTSTMSLFGTAACPLSTANSCTKSYKSLLEAFRTHAQ